MKATDKKPKYDVELSDGNKTVGLMLVNGKGENDPLAIQRSPYPRTSTKISSGGGKYDDYELPYKSIVQDDWIGGRASLNLEDDTTRFMDSFRAWSEFEKQVCLGGQERYCNNFGEVALRQTFQHLPGDIEWFPLIDTQTSIAHCFTTDPSQTTTAYKLAFYLKRVGTPKWNLYYSIWNNVDDKPDNNTGPIDSGYITPADMPDKVSILKELTLDLGLAGNTKYWIVVYATSDTSIETHYEVGVDPNSSGTNNTRYDHNGTWEWNEHEVYYRVTDNNVYKFKFFEYKRGFYAIDTSYTTSSKLFINGDRGVAQSNSSDLSYLVDANKTWEVNEWAGCKVLITKGTGSIESEQSRTIISNTPTSLCVYNGTTGRDWEITHDTTTEYVILGSDKWTFQYAVNTNSTRISDIAVAGEYVYFAAGSQVYRYNERNDGGDWEIVKRTEPNAYANTLCAINTPAGWELWGGLNNHSRHGNCVWRAKVPSIYGFEANLFNLISTLDDGKDVWKEVEVSGVNVTVEDEGMQIYTSAGYAGLSDACVKTMPVTDLTRGTKISMILRSSTHQGSGNLRLRMDDTQMLGRNYLPEKVWHHNIKTRPNNVVLRRSWNKPTQVYYFDDSLNLGYDWFPLSNLHDYESTYSYKMSYFYTSDVARDFIFLSYPDRMTGFYILMGSQKNGQAGATMKVDYWDGDNWTNIASISDGTSPVTTSLVQSGLVTFAVPADWNKGAISLEADKPYTSYLATDRYHLRISWDRTLTANVDIIDIRVQGNGESEEPASYQFQSLSNVKDVEQFGTVSPFIFHNNDQMYITSSKRFNRIKVYVSSAYNTVPCTLVGYYWTGEAYTGWSNLGITDGTASGVATLGINAQVGDITFNMPSGWETGCPEELQPYLSDTDYVVRLAFTSMSAAWSSETMLISIELMDDNYEDLYTLDEMENVKDGNSSTYDLLSLSVYEYIIVLGNTKFNKVHITLPGTKNSTESTMYGEYFNGNTWASLSYLYDGTKATSPTRTLATSGDIEFTMPYDWQQITIGEETGYAVRFYTNWELTRSVKITEIYIVSDDSMSLALPELWADEWTYVELDIYPGLNPTPDPGKIVSMGLYIQTPGVQTIDIANVSLITDAMDYYKLGDARVNSIEAYGDERMNPWVFTEDMIYEIQTQNDNSVVPMPLREIKGLSSEKNGMATTVSNVYLVFNLGTFIQKYYQHNLDDIGPNRDEGLPTNRQGDPVSLFSYPGRLFLAINAEEAGYSTIMLQRSGGWHEIYRSPLNCAISDMGVQVIPGMSTRLWISQDSELLWLPLPTGTWNPKNDSKFRFTQESTIVTGWINAGFLDVSKVWKSVKLYTENLSGSDQYIVCEYQIEDGELESGWIPVEEVFNESPFQENLISSNYDVSARRIRFRLRLLTTSSTESPILKAIIIESLLRFPVKYSYNMTYRLEDDPEGYEGVKIKTGRSETLAEILDSWADQPIVLTFRCNYSPYDNKKVVIEPYSLKPLQLDTDAQFEKHIGQITLLGA